MAETTTRVAAGRKSLLPLADGLDDLADELALLANELERLGSPRVVNERLRSDSLKAHHSARLIREGAYGPPEGHLYDMLLNMPPRERRVWASHRLVNKTLPEVAAEFGIEEERAAEMVQAVDERLGIA